MLKLITKFNHSVVAEIHRILSDEPTAASNSILEAVTNTLAEGQPALAKELKNLAKNNDKGWASF